jgi:hypothetical protein
MRDVHDGQRKLQVLLVLRAGRRAHAWIYAIVHARHSIRTAGDVGRHDPGGRLLDLPEKAKAYSPALQANIVLARGANQPRVDHSQVSTDREIAALKPTEKRYEASIAGTRSLSGIIYETRQRPLMGRFRLRFLGRNFLVRRPEDRLGDMLWGCRNLIDLVCDRSPLRGV